MSGSPSVRRRLLTQLEVAKGGRSHAAGDGKMAASAKGPDGVIMYELHSRPEQEKFNESAKVTEEGEGDGDGGGRLLVSGFMLQQISVSTRDE